MNEKQTKFSDIPEANAKGGKGGADSVDNFMNKELRVTGIEQVLRDDGEPMLVVKLEGGASFRTGSKVLRKQGVWIKARTDKGEVVITSIVKKRGKDSGREYFCFV